MAKKDTTEKTPPKDITAKAFARYLRISPRKVRLVINTVRNRPVHQAFGILGSLKNKAARLTEKLLKSAVGNAKVLGLAEERLYVSAIYADGGPTFKRFMSRSMGRADRLLKRTSHLSLFVKEGEKIYPKFEANDAKEAAEASKPKKKAKKAAAGKA